MKLAQGIVNLHDHEAHARAALDAATWAYIEGGAADEWTLRRNQQAWQELALLPRVLRPLAHSHTRCTLLGTTWPHPILVAPMAFQRLAHADGEIAMALAAAAQGAGLVLSTQTSTPLQQVATAFLGETERGPLWFQLYLQHDRGFNLELVRQAEQAGYEALVLTVDAPVNGARDRERRAGFKLPPHVSAVHLRDLPAPPAADPAQRQLNELLAVAPTWDDVAWLQSVTRLPVLLKGISHPDDARQAAALGLAALIVSNHGGRTLDTALPTAHLLPRMAQAVGGQTQLLVDGGIRRGTDIFKALALGADAVLVGRPCLHGLAHAGAWGVAHVLRLLRDELEIAMALCGCQSLQDISPALIEPHPGGRPPPL